MTKPDLGGTRRPSSYADDYLPGVPIINHVENPADFKTGPAVHPPFDKHPLHRVAVCDLCDRVLGDPAREQRIIDERAELRRQIAAFQAAVAQVCTDLERARAYNANAAQAAAQACRTLSEATLFADPTKEA